MTTVLDEPADLLKLVGQPVGTTEWMRLTQQQLDLIAEATGDRRRIRTNAQRGDDPFNRTIAELHLALALTPALIEQVLEIRELTIALNYGINNAWFLAPVRVGSRIRATVTVMSAQQKASGVETVFTLSYEIDRAGRPACVTDVIVLYP
jgi:acyl dehydratase